MEAMLKIDGQTPEQIDALADAIERVMGAHATPNVVLAGLDTLKAGVTPSATISNCTFTNNDYLPPLEEDDEIDEAYMDTFGGEK